MENYNKEHKLSLPVIHPLFIAIVNIKTETRKIKIKNVVVLTYKNVKFYVRLCSKTSHQVHKECARSRVHIVCVVVASLQDIPAKIPSGSRNKDITGPLIEGTAFMSFTPVTTAPIYVYMYIHMYIICC